MNSDILMKFRGTPVLVAGDLMLDEFVWGQVSRISPEAPVPVVEVLRRTQTAGGAANTAVNVASLGGRPVVAGVVGDDAEGLRICEILDAQGVDTAPIVRDAKTPTTTKTRIVAHNQQVVRIDHDRSGPLSTEVEEELCRWAAGSIAAVRGCVISDYGKGVVSAKLTKRFIDCCRQSRVPVVIDPKGTDYNKYRGATLVKPNQLEAGKVLNRDLRSDADVQRAGGELLNVLGPGTAVLITQGANGMTLFEPGRRPVHIPTQAREVFDVTGAGDTVAGTLALALSAGADLPTACRLASMAAAVVVGKVGTATCSLDELRSVYHAVRWRAAG